MPLTVSNSEIKRNHDIQMEKRKKVFRPDCGDTAPSTKVLVSPSSIRENRVPYRHPLHRPPVTRRHPPRFHDKPATLRGHRAFDIPREIPTRCNYMNPRWTAPNGTPSSPPSASAAPNALSSQPPSPSSHRSHTLHPPSVPHLNTLRQSEPNRTINTISSAFFP
jgi:hypothetical protein